MSKGRSLPLELLLTYRCPSKHFRLHRLKKFIRIILQSARLSWFITMWNKNPPSRRPRHKSTQWSYNPCSFTAIYHYHSCPDLSKRAQNWKFPPLLLPFKHNPAQICYNKLLCSSRRLKCKKQLHEDIPATWGVTQGTARNLAIDLILRKQDMLSKTILHFFLNASFDSLWTPPCQH